MDRDIFAYVQRTWQAAAAAEKREPTALELAGVAQFVALARELFTANQAVALDCTGQTFGLRFQDGLVLPFCDVAGAPAAADPGSQPITKELRPRGSQGGLAASPSWGVTGDKS